jgi:hypothetical protein
MLIWVEEQPSGIIALIVFGFSYGMAIVVFAATAILSRRRISQDLRAITPSILSPLGTMAGLLIAFLAVRVWANLDHAVAAMADEASSIREAVLLADLLPTDKRAVIRDGVETYLHFVDARDWPAMTSGTASLREVPPGLTDAMSAVLSFAPTTPGLDLAQQRAVIALEHALEARRQRILLSEAAIAPIQWLVCLTVQALILITVALAALR